MGRWAGWWMSDIRENVRSELMDAGLVMYRLEDRSLTGTMRDDHMHSG